VVLFPSKLELAWESESEYESESDSEHEYESESESAAMEETLTNKSAAH